MIEIKRRLHDGIYRSQGGGQVQTIWSWPTTARSLLAAAKALPLHRNSSITAYGNIGAGHSWVEIDGFVLDSFEIDQINMARECRDQEARNLRMPTATQYAAKVIADIARKSEDAA